MFFSKKQFKVSFQGRVGLTYSENKKKMLIDSELFFDPAGVTIYSDSMVGWEIPFDKEELSKDDKERILKNIVNDLEKNKYRVDIA